jgi:hypothetical protein
MVGILERYRRIPIFAAWAIAAVGAIAVALGLTIAGVFTLSKVLDKLDESGPGAGVLLITAIPNIAVPTFIVALSILVKFHGQASWKIPTIAFLLATIATWIWIGPLDLVFAPVVLGTGAVAWAISCLMLRQKGAPEPHAL